MISKVSIKNFKSVVDLELELGKVNVFIGENGCGKTNILEAITCLGVSSINSSLEFFNENRYIQLSDTLMSLKGIRAADSILLKSAFNPDALEEGNLNIDLAPEIHGINERSETYGMKIIERKEGFWKIGIKSNISEETNEKLRTEGNLEVHNKNYSFPTSSALDLIFSKNTITSFTNYTPENYFLRRFEEEGQIKPLGIRGEGLFKHLMEIYKKNPELLEKISEKLKLISWFDGLEIPKDLFFTEKRLNLKDKYLPHLEYFDQRSANEGFLYLLFYFTLFISPYTPNFFAIDNIDNALNPKLGAELIRQLTTIAKENGKQAILTTHNPAILDGLDLTDDDQRLFTIYRNADGHTVAKRVKPPKHIKGVETVRLSEAYIRGYLGGIPKNF